MVVALNPPHWHDCSGWVMCSVCSAVTSALYSLPSQFDMLEMDRLERQLVNLPLLQDPSSYIPDTVDLTEDALARQYWLYCFEEALDGVTGTAAFDWFNTNLRLCVDSVIPTGGCLSRLLMLDSTSCGLLLLTSCRLILLMRKFPVGGF